ncbi:MAG: hypothetical protein FH756_05070 [Firmicutes bacterium]|nr:hypothetical protein [Bacillota bacterium]
MNKYINRLNKAKTIYENREKIVGGASFIKKHREQIIEIFKSAEWNNLKSGRVIINEETINKTWKPILLEELKEKDVDTLDISFVNECILIKVKGLAKGVPYFAKYLVKIEDFNFDHTSHKVVLDVHEEIKGRGNLLNKMCIGISKMFITGLFRQSFAKHCLKDKKGVHFSNNKIYIDFDEMDYFKKTFTQSINGIPLDMLVVITLEDVFNQIIFKINLEHDPLIDKVKQTGNVVETTKEQDSTDNPQSSMLVSTGFLINNFLKK